MNTITAKPVAQAGQQMYESAQVAWFTPARQAGAVVMNNLDVSFRKGGDITAMTAELSNAEPTDQPPLMQVRALPSDMGPRPTIEKTLASFGKTLEAARLNQFREGNDLMNGDNSPPAGSVIVSVQTPTAGNGLNRTYSFPGTQSLPAPIAAVLAGAQDINKLVEKHGQLMPSESPF